VLREGCSVVGLGSYLTRSTLRIQSTQLPVGCMSTCGFVGWTSKVTMLAVLMAASLKSIAGS